jgi:hypothetical protein
MGTVLALAAVALVGWWVAQVRSVRQFDDTTGDDVRFSYGVLALADAITVAEGSDPRYNNPGDIKVADWTGPTFGAEHIPVFNSPTEGRNRLYAQLTLIETGRSHYYQRSMTLADMGRVWAGDDHWAANVASRLGVPVTTTLEEIFG